MSKQQILTPVGRLVAGSLYKPSTKDADGNPLTFKSGADVGKARVNYFLGLAIPKVAGEHWSTSDWGRIIYSVGAAAFPQAHKSAAFAWKVTDGDDKTPNMRGKAPCDTEGFPGNWILKFSGSFAPKVYREENGAYVQVTEENYIKAGYYIQVSGTVDGNGSQQRPGLFLNPSMVAFTAYGQEIHFGPDANSVGFGKSALPVGASAVPLASTVPMPLPTTQTTPVPAAVPPVFPQTPASVPPPPSGPKMTDKAKGASYQSFKVANWTDEQLIAQGYMTA